MWTTPRELPVANACATIVALALALPASAQDATWTGGGVPNNEFNNAANWNAGTVPTNTAFFGVAPDPNISFSFNTTIGGFTFNPGASAYTFTTPIALRFTGAGIINGGSASFVNAPGAQTIIFDNASTAGRASFNISLFSALQFLANSNADASQITNSSSLSFFHSSSAANATIQNNLMIRFGQSSSAGNATITSIAGSGIAFRDNSTAGAATLTNNSVALIIPLFCCGPSDPGLLFTNNSTAGSATIFNNGLLEFHDNSNGGSARLVNTGTADFSATSGPLADGRLSIGSIEGSGRLVLNGRELTIGSNNLSTTFAGTLSERRFCVGGNCPPLGGSIVKVGAGTLTLSGTSDYTGPTIVNAGTLRVDGSISASSSTIVNAEGTVGGTGTLGNTAINGGTLAPGNSIGTINVLGNLTFTAAATYLVEVDPNASDRTNVTGTATLGGATVSAIYAPGSYVWKRYTILNAAGGVYGTFNTLINTNLPANFTPSLSYDSNNAYLDLTLTAFAPNNGYSGNQNSVASALVHSFSTAGGIPLSFGLLTPQRLTQVSGEAAAGTQQTTFQAMDAFMNVMTDPFRESRSDGRPNEGATGYADEDLALAHAARSTARSAAEREAYARMAVKSPLRARSLERRWSVWGAGYGGSQSTDGNAATGSADVRSRIYGGAAGFDYRLTPDMLVGFSLAGAGTTYNLANQLGGGRSEMFQAGIYGRTNFGAAYLAGALAYGWQDVTTDRNVFLNSYRANFDANAISGRLEGGYRFAFGASGLTPYAAGHVTTFFLPAYAEQVVAGTNLFALSYAKKDVIAPRSELGLRADTSFAMQDAILTLRGRAAWAHNFNTDRSASAIFQTLPASGFIINGAAQAHDAALVTASAETRWLNGFSVAATFEGEFSRVTDSYAGKGVIRYQW